MTVKSVK